MPRLCTTQIGLVPNLFLFSKFLLTKSRYTPSIFLPRKGAFYFYSLSINSFTLHNPIQDYEFESVEICSLILWRGIIWLVNISIWVQTCPDLNIFG